MTIHRHFIINSASKKTTLFYCFCQEGFKDKAFEALKIKEFTFVNDCFQNENNAVFGVFLQRLNKPYGFLSQFVDNSAERKGLLGELYDFPEGVMAIGRLDKDSEGLLFITSDGKLSSYIRSKHIEKEYYVQVAGEIDDVSIEQLKKGVNIYTTGKYFTTSPCKVKRLETIPDLPPLLKRPKKQGPTTWIAITLKEGRKRQVRKMTGRLGFPTLRLLRVRIGSVHLKSLKPGGVLEVSSFGEEIAMGYQLL